MTPLPEIVDGVIQSSPIDVRRGLYKACHSCSYLRSKVLIVCSQNIVLSGGSTMFTHFGQRLKRDLKQLVDRRLEASVSSSGGMMKVKPLLLLMGIVPNPAVSRAVWRWTSFPTRSNDTLSGSVVHCSHHL